MVKRKTSDLLKEIYNLIKNNPDITMSELERKTGTNPNSLVEHCKVLEHFKLVKIERAEGTRRLKVVR